LSSALSARRAPQRSTLVPYTTLFRSERCAIFRRACGRRPCGDPRFKLLQLTPAASAKGCVVGILKSAFIAKHSIIICPYGFTARSEEHTSELQSRENLVCRLLLEKKK